MKKRVFTVLVFMLIVTSTIYAQSKPEADSSFERIEYLIDKCLSLLDNPVPGEFQLFEPNFYMNKEGIAVRIEKGLIFASMAMIVMPPNEEALNVAYVYALSLLGQRYGFINLRGAGNSVILNKNNLIATVHLQRHDNVFILIVGFSDRILTF